MAFEIHPLGRFRSSNTVIKRPREIACFSYDDDHKFHLDDRSLRYYYPPKLGADLCKGFETFQKADDSQDEHLDSLLKTLKAHEAEMGAKAEADIVTWRGMMTKIMAAPYDNFNGFEMNATLFQGTIFIEENHPYKQRQHAAQAAQPRGPSGHSQDMMSYWGYKFEALCVLPATWDATPRDHIESREQHRVSNLAQYCSVVRTGVGAARLVLGGEVDAVWDAKPAKRGAPVNWVELKTSAAVRGPRDMHKYERKLLKFWVQSFLLGVPKIVVGFRDQRGRLERMEELETQNIPTLVKKKGQNTWDGNTCINFTAAFLDWLKTVITSEGVWRIRREDKSPRIEVFQVEEEGHGNILCSEFVEWRNREKEEN